MRAIRAVTRTGVALYTLLQKTRAAAYDAGLLPTTRIDGVEIISIGNVRMGGTGKTPLTLYLAEHLRGQGRSVTVISRGYKGRLTHRGGVVSLGRGPLVSPREAGDEPYLMARRLRDVTVRVGRHRVEQAMLARDAGADVLILDDGFQHRRIHRDMDIVLVNPDDLLTTPMSGSVLLRESKAALDRAHLIGGPTGDWSGTGVTPDFTFEVRVIGTVGQDGAIVSATVHHGARAHLMTAIAAPERFAETAERAGFVVSGRSFLRDHRWFTSKDMRSIETAARSNGADLILTTEKDLPKLMDLRSRLPVRALRIDLELVTGKERLHRKLESCKILK